MALLLGSALICVMLLYASWYGVRILYRWDIRSGSEEQLSLERRTYLISTILAYAFAFQLLSLFLFIYTAERIHTLFVGAMCAAGVLNVNVFGYPTLGLKCVNFLLAGLWLILNAADNRACDYPLIRKKYLLLLGIAPFLLAEAVLQALFFLNLKPDVITSCCGALFSFQRQGVPAGLATLPQLPLMAAFYLGAPACLAAGLYYWRKGTGGYLFSAFATATFAVSILSLISFLCLYFYEMPSHHCPFCILKKEYKYVGYLLYAGMMGGGVTGVGVGLLMPFRGVESLKGVLPVIQRRLTLASVILYGLFTALSTARMVTASLRLDLF
jgi:hypothetical protein